MCIRDRGYDVKDENAYRGDIAIEYTGLRPGEKLFEELLIGESVTGTEHPKIMRAEEDFLPWKQLENMLSSLRTACAELRLEDIRQLLMVAVVGFEPEGLLDDPLWMDRERDVKPEEAKVTVEGAGAAKPAPAKVTPLRKR